MKIFERVKTSAEETRNRLRAKHGETPRIGKHGQYNKPEVLRKVDAIDWRSLGSTVARRILRFLIAHVIASYGTATIGSPLIVLLVPQAFTPEGVLAVAVAAVVAPVSIPFAFVAICFSLPTAGTLFHRSLVEVVIGVAIYLPIFAISLLIQNLRAKRRSLIGFPVVSCSKKNEQ